MLLAIPTKARNRAVALRLQARKTNAPEDMARENGFFDALRLLLPSEVVGLIVMDVDAAAVGEPMFTDSLPRLDLTGGNNGKTEQDEGPRLRARPCTAAA